MDAREAAGVLAQCKWLKDQIKQWEDEAKSVVLQHSVGGERLTAALPDGTKLGAVSIVDGAKSMHIDNPDGFLYWVKQRYPTEIVETVRDSFVKVCADKVKTLGGLPDANGEMCPHVSLVKGDPYTKPTLDKLAGAIMQDIVSRRRLPELLAPQPDSVTQEMVDGEVVTTEKWRVATDPVELKALIVADNPLLPPTEPEPELSQDDSVEPEPWIEEGPPHWRESNTFETSDAVHNRRQH